uniref:Doublecortin domain-containing protein n=1 Tax=Anopheles culicifacies TaxID=139723 RepID=A0A182MIU3_9DIPT
MIYYHDSSSSGGDDPSATVRSVRKIPKTRHRTPEPNVRVLDGGNRSVIELKKPPGDPVHLKVQLLTASDRQVEIAVSLSGHSITGASRLPVLEAFGVEKRRAKIEEYWKTSKQHLMEFLNCEEPQASDPSETTSTSEFYDDEYDDEDDVEDVRVQQPDQRRRVRAKGANSVKQYAGTGYDIVDDDDEEEEEAEEEGFIDWTDGTKGGRYLNGGERAYHALVDAYDESDQPEGNVTPPSYFGRVPYNVSRASGPVPPTPLPRPVAVRPYVRPGSRFYRRHSPLEPSSLACAREKLPTQPRYIQQTKHHQQQQQQQREASISSPGSPVSSGDGPKQRVARRRFLAMTGDADAVRTEHEPDRARTPPNPSASIGATNTESGPNDAQPMTAVPSDGLIGSGTSAVTSGPPVASTGSSATVPSTATHAPTSSSNGTSQQQQQNLVNNNHSNTASVDAPGDTGVPGTAKRELNAKGASLVRSKESVSPLPLKRPQGPGNGLNGIGGKDTNNNAPGEGHRSPQGATTQSTANGPGQTPTNPNQPTRPIGGIKGRKGGGWKARPDSESFGNALNSPTDEDELLGGSPITVRRQPINVNPVITRDKLASTGGIGGGSGVGGGSGSGVGGGGGGGGGWGPRQRGGPVERGSRIQSPATGTVPHLHGGGGGGGPVGVAGGTSMDVGSEGASQPAAANATGTATASAGGPAPGTAASTPGTAAPQQAGPVPVKRSQSRNDVLDLDSVPGPSGLLPSNPGVPGTIGGNPQSRYSNLSFWKARRVLFYRNGDPFFPGVEFRFKPGRDICTLEALLDKISARMDLPRGARYIFSMDGDRKYSLDELEDGSSYVVSSFKVFKVSPGKAWAKHPTWGSVPTHRVMSVVSKSVSRLGF